MKTHKVVGKPFEALGLLGPAVCLEMGLNKSFVGDHVGVRHHDDIGFGIMNAAIAGSGLSGIGLDNVTQGKFGMKVAQHV